MKPFINIVTALALSVLFELSSHPVRADWTANGIPIAASDSVEDHPLIADDGARGAFIAWQSHESGYPYYYVKRIMPSGSIAPGWSAEGLEISGAANDGRIIPDGAGGALVCWVITNYAYPYQGTVAVNRVMSAGTLAPGWPEHGVTLDGTPAGFASPAGVESPRAYGPVNPWAVSDGAGGAMVAWTYVDRLNSFVRVKHFLGDGTVRGDALGSYTFGYWPQICSDGNSGAFVSRHGALAIWHVLSSDTLDSHWPLSGNVFTTDPSAISAGLCPDGAGGLFAAWLEVHGGVAQYVLHHLTDSGAIAPGWQISGLVLSPYNCQAGGFRKGPYYFDQRFTSMVPDGSGGALVAWQDSRADTGDIYVQRILPDGSIAPGWTANGVAAAVAPGLQEYPVLVGDGSGGAVIAWQDERRDSDSDVYAQHVLANGALVPGTDPAGIPVCTAAGIQSQPQIVGDGGGGAIITWTDYRRGNADVYAARLGSDGVVGTLTSLVRADARPGEVDLEWSTTLGLGASAELSRRDDAHDWNVLGTLGVVGSGRFVYQDRTVSPGQRYRYRLGLHVEGRLEYAPEVEVSVPAVLGFALGPVRPNPTWGEVVVDFSLPDRARAWIEIVDVQGRVRLHREVESPSGGRHTLRLTRRGQLPMGLYWVRLVHGGEARRVRVAVLQ